MSTWRVQKVQTLVYVVQVLPQLTFWFFPTENHENAHILRAIEAANALVQLQNARFSPKIGTASLAEALLVTEQLPYIKGTILFTLN